MTISLFSIKTPPALFAILSASASASAVRALSKFNFFGDDRARKNSPF